MANLVRRAARHSNDGGSGLVTASRRTWRQFPHAHTRCTRQAPQLHSDVRGAIQRVDGRGAIHDCDTDEHAVIRRNTRARLACATNCSAASTSRGAAVCCGLTHMPCGTTAIAKIRPRSQPHLAQLELSILPARMAEAQNQRTLHPHSSAPVHVEGPGVGQPKGYALRGR